MSLLTHPSRFRRVGTALALLGGSAIGAATALLTMGGDDTTTAAYYADVATRPDLHAWSGLANVVAFPLLLAGVLGIVHLIRGRGVTLAHLGAVLAVLGLGTFPALAGTEVLDVIGVQTLGEEQMVALTTDGYEQSGYGFAYVLIPLVAGLLGALLIGLAVGRSGLAPWWVAGAVVAGTVLLMAPGDLWVVGNLLHLVGFGAVALRMLRLDDAAWDTPPADWRPSGPRPRAATGPAPAPVVG